MTSRTWPSASTSARRPPRWPTTSRSVAPAGRWTTRSPCWSRPRPTSGSGSTSPPRGSPTRRRSSASSTVIGRRAAERWPRSRRPPGSGAAGWRRVLKILAVDDAVERAPAAGSPPAQPWYFDTAKWDALRRVRAAEADLMRRVRARRGLPDASSCSRPWTTPTQRPCGRCSVCTGELPAPGRPASAQDRRCRATVLPGPGRDDRAAQAVGGAAARPQGQDHIPGPRAARSPTPTTRPGAPNWPRSGRPTGRPRR